MHMIWMMYMMCMMNITLLCIWDNITNMKIMKNMNIGGRHLHVLLIVYVLLI